MPITQSRDGTRIAYSRTGQGSPLVLVDGAFCHRTFGANVPLPALLSQRFTVYTYDRRGRGESGDTLPYAIEREIEDLDAVIRAAGGSAFAYGISSGAALALEAVNRGVGISKLALYEAPFIVDRTRAPIPSDFVARLATLVAANRRGDAVRLFMTKGVAVPAIFVMLMRVMPSWSKLEAIAHTVVYDMTITNEHQHGEALPRGRWNSITAPVLSISGAKSPPWLRNAMQALADVLPNARYRTLPGQTHMVKAEALVPVLIEFFGEAEPTGRAARSG